MTMASNAPFSSILTGQLQKCSYLSLAYVSIPFPGRRKAFAYWKKRFPEQKRLSRNKPKLLTQSLKALLILGSNTSLSRVNSSIWLDDKNDHIFVFLETGSRKLRHLQNIWNSAS